MASLRTLRTLEGKVVERIEFIAEEFDTEDEIKISQTTTCVIHFTDGGRFTLSATGDSHADAYYWIHADWKAGRRLKATAKAKAAAKKKR